MRFPAAIRFIPNIADGDLKKRVEAAAKKDGITVSEWLRRAVKAALQDG